MDNNQNIAEFDAVQQTFAKSIAFCIDDAWESQLPKAIMNNAAEVEKFLIAQTESDRNTVVTEDTVEQAKSRRAELNKQAKLIDDQRKAVKKAWNEPYTDFENKCKRLQEVIKSASDGLDVQIKSFEQAERDAKEAEYERYYETLSTVALQYRPWLAISNPKWLLKGSRREDVQAELVKIAEATETDITAIKQIAGENEAALLEKYKEGATLTEIIAYNEKLKAYKANNPQTEQKPDEPQKTPQNENLAGTEGNQPQTDELKVIDFRVWATAEQLQALKKCLTDNHIKYGKVPTTNN